MFRSLSAGRSMCPCHVLNHSLRVPRAALALAWSALALVPLALAAQTSTVALPEAERLALERDAELRRLAAEREALAARAVAAGELPDPRISVGPNNVPVDSFSLDEEDMTMIEVGVSQMFPAGRSLSLARSRLTEEARAVEARMADRRRLVQRELRMSWIDRAELLESVRLIDEQIAWLEPMIAAATASYGHGQLRQLDVLNASLEQAMLSERLIDLRRERAAADAAVERWTGLPAESTAAGMPSRRDWPELALLESRLSMHPTQRDFEQRIAAADTSVELMRQRYRPDWELALAYGFRDGRGMDGGPRSDMLSAMLSFNLPLFTRDRQDREVASARAELRAVREMHLDHDRELRAELATAWRQRRELGELEELYERRLLTLGENASRAASAAYANDTAQFDEVVQARRVWLELELGRLRAAADRARADAALIYLVGEES
ncbi:MAG TPA: TolC family protein [Gammaproteobacteria bacterium]|nr:TolC family protein [Gammaproteobacteria bacterium]